MSPPHVATRRPPCSAFGANRAASVATDAPLRPAPTRSDVVGRAPVRSDDDGGEAAGDRVFLVSKINRRRRYDGDGDGDDDDDIRRPRRRGAKREPSNGDVAHVIRVRARGG